MTDPKKTFLTLRVTRELKDKVRDKARLFGREADVLREILEAFVDNRLVVKSPTTRKENLYVD